MRRIFILIYFVLYLFPLSAQFDVKKFGAKGDGSILDTRSIQDAIDKANQNGGGTVDVPAGTYKVGTLILKDNITLHLQPGAVILGSPDIKDYAEVSQKFESRTFPLYAKYFMIFAEGVKNISITGQGIIHGNGLKNFQVSDPQNLRPFTVRLVNCENVTIRDVHILEAANWTLHLLGCRDVNIDGVVIENGAKANRDGLDIDCCQRVTVSNCRFSTGDDAIVMKASADILCQDIAITNCIIRTNASAIKTGTESNGGFKNITVSNCVIKDLPVHAGIELMTVDGGIMQNILIENITMENVATPVFIRLGIRARPYKNGQYVNKMEDAKDIQLNNISVINAKLPSSIMGLHNKKIKNVTISNYTVRYSETQKSIAYNKVPFEEFSYPMAVMFKNLPAYGLYCRNVEDLSLHNISMYSAENEKRPAMAFDRVDGLELNSVRADTKNKLTPLAHVRNTKNAIAAFCKTPGVNNALFEVEEANCENLTSSNNILEAGQLEMIKAEALPDEQIFEDFNTDIKYIVEQGDKIRGLAAQDLKSKPLNVTLDINKRGILQLCLLVLNESSKSSKVLIKYEGITQEFTVSWNEWGWAPISLLKEYQENRKVNFEITAADPDSGIKISRVYLRYQDVKKTD